MDETKYIKLKPSYLEHNLCYNFKLFLLKNTTISNYFYSKDVDCWIEIPESQATEEAFYVGKILEVSDNIQAKQTVKVKYITGKGPEEVSVFSV